MIICDRAIEDIESYKAAEKTPGEGDYMDVVQEFNKFNEKYNAKIPANKDIYCNIHVVECPKGTEFTVK